MINLLLSLAVEKELSRNAVRQIKDRVKLNHLYMIVADEEELPVFEQEGECLLRKNVARGIYDDKQLDLEHSFPLEDDVIQFMNQYSLEIIFQQRRFELYPEFQIPELIDSHYTIYRYNLFFWYNYLRRKQITHVFFSAIPHEGYDAVIYYLCRYLKIPVQIVHSCFIPFRWYPLQDFSKASPELKIEYHKLLEQYKDKDVSDIPLEGKTADMFQRWSSKEPDQMKPWYMRNNPFVRRLRQHYHETNLIRIWRRVLGKDYVQYGLGYRFWLAAIWKIPALCKAIPLAWKRYLFVRPVKKKSIRYRNYYQMLATDIVEGEKYIYFPLQYQPEATSNPMGGGMYADQTIPLQILSRALPEGMKIYVKQHPEQLSLMRTEKYYKEIASIPKVRMVKLECSTYELMSHAVAVSCLTGTALWECHFFGVPALAFGYSVKNHAPFTYPVRTVKDCQNALEEIMKNSRQDMLRELKIYVKAMHNISFAVEDIAQAVPEIVERFIYGIP